MSAITKFALPTDKIAEFCRRWHILEFSLFGSVLTDQFRPDSDIDVLVEFAPEVLYTFGQLDTIQAELEEIFGRPVDLIDKKGVQESPNYLRRRNILGSAQLIYAQ